MTRPPKSHPVFHVVEAPLHELEWTMEVHGPFPKRVDLPAAVKRSTVEGSVVVLGALSKFVPAFAWAAANPKSIRVGWVMPEGRRVPALQKQVIIVRLSAEAKHSPPPWEKHTRQQFQRTQRHYGRAVP